MITYQLIQWVHLLSVLGVFGGLLIYQLGLAASVRNDEANARGMARILNIFLGIGLLSGLALYAQVHGQRMGGHYNGVVGTMFIILVIVGGLIAMSKRPGKGDTFRTISIILLAVAALLGVTL